MNNCPDESQSILDNLDSMLSTRLRQDESDIWVSRTKKEAISYPEEGHQSCFTIEDNSLWFQHRNRCIYQAVSEFPSDGPLFDIGGGNGFVSQYLQDNGLSCCLVEPGPIGAYNARVNRNLSHVICGTATELEFLQGTLNSIGLFDVLEHIDDSAAFLSELHNLLSPGGRLYLTVPAYKWLWSASDVRAMHFRRYTQKSLKMELRNAGFEVEYITGIFKALIPGIFLFRSILSLWGLIKPNKNRARQTQEHGASGGFGWQFLTRLLEYDLRKIKSRKNSVGASILCVAKKPRKL